MKHTYKTHSGAQGNQPKGAKVSTPKEKKEEKEVKIMLGILVGLVELVMLKNDANGRFRLLLGVFQLFLDDES